jgi:hypothetical protein
MRANRESGRKGQEGRDADGSASKGPSGQKGEATPTKLAVHRLAFSKLNMLKVDIFETF